MKKLLPTIAELRAGRVTPKQREQFKALLIEVSQELAGMNEQYLAWEAEAERLFEALEDADLPQTEAYLRQNPPSSGAIAILMIIAQDRYKTQKQRDIAKGDRPSLLNDALRQLIKNKPDITPTQAKDALDRRFKKGPTKITRHEDSGKLGTAKISGLKDRLARIRNPKSPA